MAGTALTAGSPQRAVAPLPAAPARPPPPLRGATLDAKWTANTKASQTITFAALANKTLARSTVTVSAKASSNLTVSFTATTPAVGTSGGTNGATITLVKAGTCTVSASQAGNATYDATPTVSRNFALSKARKRSPLRPWPTRPWSSAGTPLL